MTRAGKEIRRFHKWNPARVLAEAIEHIQRGNRGLKPRWMYDAGLASAQECHRIDYANFIGVARYCEQPVEIEERTA